MVRGGVCALFLAICTTPATADISAYFASVAFDETASLESGPGFGVRWGNSSKVIGGETSLMIARPSRTGSLGDESTTAIFYEGRLMINVPTGTAIAPFVGIGLGAITVLSTDIPTSIDNTDAQTALSAVADTQTNRALSYGGGVRYTLSDKASLRIDVRRYSVFSVTSLARDALIDQGLDAVEGETGIEVPEEAADRILDNATEEKTVAHNELSIGINFNF